MEAQESNIRRRLIPLYLKEYFETHKHLPVTREELLSYLYCLDIPIGRKTLIYHIEALKLYGMDIQVEKGKHGAYFFQGYKEVNND